MQTTKEFTLIKSLYNSGKKQTRPVTYTVTAAGCFECTSHKPGSSGYPRITLGGKSYRMSRFIWERINGPIPTGFYICHTCDNPRCINPKHLFLGTPTDNVNDMYKKNRAGIQGKSRADIIERIASPQRGKPRLRGEACGRHKLTACDVVAIRELVGSATYVELAKRFHTTPSNIVFIVKRRTWKDV